KQEYDYVLIDCPAGIEQGFENAIAGAEEAIVVTTPEKSSVRDADRIIGLIEQKDINRPRLVINRIRQHMMNDVDALDIEDVVQLLYLNLLMNVLESDNVNKASNS